MNERTSNKQRKRPSTANREVNRCHFNRMCWEQSLNLLSLYSICGLYCTVFLLCIFRFLFGFLYFLCWICEFSYLLVVAPRTFLSGCSVCIRFVLVCVCLCVCIASDRVSKFNRKTVIKKIIIRTASKKNHVEFDNFQLPALFTQDQNRFTHKKKFLPCISHFFCTALQFQIGIWLLCGFTDYCLFDFCRRTFFFVEKPYFGAHKHTLLIPK